MTNKNPLDRNVSLRLPVELLHALENRVARANIAREGKRDQFEDVPPATLSDCIRRMCEIGLAVVNEDPSRVNNLLAPMVERRLQEIFTLSVRDGKARALLKMISERGQAEDFP